MNQTSFVANAILWASAIVAAAIVDAPPFFTLGLLPALAAGALLTTRPRTRLAVARRK